MNGIPWQNGETAHRFTISLLMTTLSLMPQGQRLFRFHAALCAALLMLHPHHAEAAEGSGKPRIGLLLSSDGRHHDEFDSALATLGWAHEKFPAKPEVMKELPGKLDGIDLLLAAPLFNLDKKNLPGEDRIKYRKFLEEGGMIAITDGSYEGARGWLADVDPGFGGLNEGKCNSSQWEVKGATVNVEPPHPLRFFPFQITEPNSWPHFHQLPDGSKWQVVATCSEGYPVTFAQRVGKGLIVLSALRQPSSKQLENFYACLLLNRVGVQLESFTLPEPAMGDGKLELELAGAESGVSGSFIYEITPKGGKAERFEKPINGKSLVLPYRFSSRGPATTNFFVKLGGKEHLLFSREVELPQLVVVKPSVGRGLLSTARRFDSVGLEVVIAPDKEDLAGSELVISAKDEKGNVVSKTTRSLESGSPQSIREALNLKGSLPPGNYPVRAALSKNGRELGHAESVLKILAPHPSQTLIDEDHTLLSNGEPYFPIGLYHVKGVDYGKVKELGINTVQYWTWDGKAGLAKLAEHGLKAIFELNHKSEKIVRDVVKEHGDNPAILMWYGMDEPSEGGHGMADMMHRTFNEEDEQRPVYLVSCRPDIFPEQSRFCDVFAVDPYGSPQKVKEWLSGAVEATQGRKPVICVPGVFGKETSAELRATTYIALAKDARGIMWYPWEQTGGGPVGIGLKNSPEQQAVIKQLCTEINALLPALTATGRVPFESPEGDVLAMHCTDGTEHYLLLVNSADRKIETTMLVPGASQVDGKFSDFFKKRNDHLTVENRGFRIALDPYETRVFLKE